MKTSVGRVLVGAALVFLVSAACSAEIDGRASPDDAHPSTGAEPAGDTGVPSPPAGDDPAVPSVVDPKDATTLEICELVPHDVAVAAGFDPEGVPDSGGPIEACVWAAEEDRTAGVSVEVNDISGGLSNIYGQRDEYADFREFEIAGHPALQATRAVWGEGYCGIFIGLSDDQYLALRSSRGLDQPDTTNPCEQAVRLAEAVVPGIPEA
ncbi:hypothetical protein FHR81_004990 [Actinoalloteichus hoggarensis]|uniref:DUF3558 domain-containing protein n=1 Tax=Actinoalloteichus hoggarensis TaxID=1470176 RepID=UPI000B8AA2AB|nr:DUF3558 domain-containing protein [Actinoalloteichus hoggarensis]MBB5923917.1 hypothetical protein [Actinoalloteichus hoggarensis]